MTASESSSATSANASLTLSRAAGSSFYLALLTVLLAILGSLGTRWGWWPFRVGFIAMLGAVLCGLTAIVLAIVGLIGTRRGKSKYGGKWAFAGLIISLIVLALPLSLTISGFRLPPIHDITTDTEKPPSFVAILQLRKDADNPSDYGGPEVAAQQQKAYPNVRPATLAVSPSEAFTKALGVARQTGWEIVDANAGEGRIEATARTFWFGFKDDVVIRVTPAGTGSRVDIRSVSRVGTSDVGANAKRIEKFLNKLSQS
ncbi:MAG TPA: DUF1499 domain-containing protein [Pyrinomonadaceae bacterium]|nr:DUF1499 domain-containing protein [Pyrinomonadaceae bacterium]